MDCDNNLKRILIVWFILYNRTCQCIQCYQCNSLVNSNCENSVVDTKYLKECSKMYNACRKLSAKYYFKKPTEYVTIRECAFLYKKEKKCYKGHQSQTSYQYICECKDHPGCNKAHTNFAIISSFYYGVLQLLVTICFPRLLI